jgi:hypothetical protein
MSAPLLVWVIVAGTGQASKAGQICSSNIPNKVCKALGDHERNGAEAR